MIDWAIAAFLFLAFLGAVEDVKRLRRKYALERRGIFTWNGHVLFRRPVPRSNRT